MRAIFSHSLAIAMSYHLTVLMFSCTGVYHKYDTIVYPKRTEISRSMTEKMSDYYTKIKGWFFKKTQTEESKDSFAPMEFYEMSVFCLHSYLDKYKDMICQGNFQQTTNIVEAVNDIAHIFNSLLSFYVRTPGIHGNSFMEQVPDANKYREVCAVLLVFRNLLLLSCNLVGPSEVTK